MIDSQIFIKKLVLMSIGVCLMTILVNSARADDRVVRNHTIALDGAVELEISNNVGRIDLVQGDGDEVRVILDIEGQKSGFFRRQVDVDDMDLQIRKRGDTLFLKFDEKNASAEWTVEMPVMKRTIIEMGVGEVRLEVGDTDLDVDLGVGDVEIVAPEDSVGRISISVGVGDASVRGAEILDRQSAFISQSVRAQGKGNKDINVDLGVGDANLRLN